MAAPILPPELQKELDDTAGKYSICIHTQQYDAALSIITDLRDRMLAWQKEYGKRFHKGYPLHNIGYALYLQNKHEEAVKYFILAYIEDLISADNEDEADSTPAGQTLLHGYKLDQKLLKPLKQTVLEFRNQDKEILEPEEVLHELEKSIPQYEKGIEESKVEPKERPKRKFTIFCTEWGKRVFIGGSGKQTTTIDNMRDTVEKLGYDAIVAVDFDMPCGMAGVYHKCLTLLHCCKYAIFDLSEHAGQLLEIERAPDYGVKTLAIWPKSREETISQILKSCLKSR
ncbi:tetratricopeptide repeat protein [Chloroflexota bacterium]